MQGTHVNEVLLVADFEICVDAEFVYVTDDRHIWNAVLWSGACSEESKVLPLRAQSATPTIAFARSLLHSLPSVTSFGRSSTDAMALSLLLNLGVLSLQKW